MRGALLLLLLAAACAVPPPHPAELQPNRIARCEVIYVISAAAPTPAGMATACAGATEEDADAIFAAILTELSKTSTHGQKPAIPAPRLPYDVSSRGDPI